MTTMYLQHPMYPYFPLTSVCLSKGETLQYISSGTSAVLSVVRRSNKAWPDMEGPGRFTTVANWKERLIDKHWNVTLVWIISLLFVSLFQLTTKEKISNCLPQEAQNAFTFSKLMSHDTVTYNFFSNWRMRHHFLGKRAEGIKLIRSYFLKKFQLSNTSLFEKKISMPIF